MSNRANCRAPITDGNDAIYPILPQSDRVFHDGDERVLVHIPSPNTLTECTCFWAFGRLSGIQWAIDDDQMAFALQVLDEDRIMCENQVPAEVPINPSRGGWGVLVTPGDTLANTFQKSFRQFLQSKTIFSSIFLSFGFQGKVIGSEGVGGQSCTIIKIAGRVVCQA